MFLLLALFMYSCDSSVDTQALKNEVLDVHDEIMPKMGEVMSLRKKILVMSKQTASIDNYDQSVVNSLDSLADALAGANRGMLSWMTDWSNNSSNFLDQDGKPIEGVTVLTVVKYLEQEKQRMLKVNEHFDSSISTAKEVLSK